MLILIVVGLWLSIADTLPEMVVPAVVLTIRSLYFEFNIPAKRGFAAVSVLMGSVFVAAKAVGADKSFEGSYVEVFAFWTARTFLFLWLFKHSFDTDIFGILDSFGERMRRLRYYVERFSDQFFSRFKEVFQAYSMYHRRTGFIKWLVHVLKVPVVAYRVFALEVNALIVDTERMVVIRGGMPDPRSWRIGRSRRYSAPGDLTLIIALSVLSFHLRSVDSFRSKLVPQPVLMVAVDIERFILEASKKVL